MGIFGPSGHIADRERRRRQREQRQQPELDPVVNVRREQLEKVQLFVGPTTGSSKLIAGVATDEDVQELDDEVEDEDLRRRTYDLAVERLQEAALSAGAEAVVNVRFEAVYDPDWNELIVTAYGDAVIASDSAVQ